MLVMPEKCLLLIAITTMLITGWYCSDNQSSRKIKLEDNINGITVVDMEHNDIDLSNYEGKVLLIVNVASECGYTYQYTGLEKIYEKYNSSGFEILAFPCNDFGEQESGSNEEIKTFCSSKFSVTFNLFDKIKVLGNEKSPLYNRLTNNSVTEHSDIKWNFEKYIISKEGKIVARFNSKIKPDDQMITNLIEAELEKGYNASIQFQLIPN